MTKSRLFPAAPFGSDVVTLGDVSKEIAFKATPDGKHKFLFMRLVEHPEFVAAGAKLVAERIRALGLANPYFVTPEASTVSLKDVLINDYQIPGRMIFKTPQADDVDPIEVAYDTVTSLQPKKLYLGKNHAAAMQGKDIIILDSICTTGGTIRGVYELLRKAGIPADKIVEATMLFVEGDDRASIQIAEGTDLHLHRFSRLPFLPLTEMTDVALTSLSK